MNVDKELVGVKAGPELLKKVLGLVQEGYTIEAKATFELAPQYAQQYGFHIGEKPRRKTVRGFSSLKYVLLRQRLLPLLLKEKAVKGINSRVADDGAHEDVFRERHVRDFAVVDFHCRVKRRRVLILNETDFGEFVALHDFSTCGGRIR